MAVAPNSLRPLRLLVCDDDELDRLCVRRMLREARVAAELQECADGSAAVRLLGDGGFDCVVLDFNLPDQSGLSVLRALRAANDGTPVVMLTGQDSAEVAVDLMKHGATDYLPKATLTADRLAQSVRHAVELAAAREEVQRSQEALRASEQFNRRMLAASADCIKVIDLDGTLLSMSEGGCRTLEIADVRTVLGRDWTAFWSGADRESARASLERARGGQTSQFRGMCPSTSGRELWWDVVVSPILDAQGRPEKFVCVSRDVTADRQRQSFEQQLLGIVSHDLRNPLHAIRMSAELLQHGEQLSERGLRCLQRIRSSSDRATRMIHDLLDFTQARLGGKIAITRSRADVVAVAQQIVDEVRLAWPEREVLATTPARVEADVDPDRIAQVLTNLLSNALQYSPPGTPIALELEAGPTELTVRINNRGAPIPADRLPTMFEPLQRGSTVGKNSRSIGLGLYIVRHLVEAHEGAVSVRSTEEAGTTFTVRLPLCSATTDGAAR